jgi:prepilin-type N-terminal cleavage/methylation domain-containing protein
MKEERRRAKVEKRASERGYTLTELMIAMLVFTVIMGSVFLLVNKSQTIFRTEMGVSEMDQNARLAIDFLTRDIQQSKENALGLGKNFRSIYSYNGPGGKTDEITIVSSDTETEIPSAGLPLVAAKPVDFSANQGSVQVYPNQSGNLLSPEVLDKIKPGEDFIVSTQLQGGTIQFDFIRISSATLTQENAIELKFDRVDHRGVVPEVPFGSTYLGGSFTMRPVSIKRYFVDKSEKDHPSLALSVNNSEPIVISRNVVAFQLRYLEQEEGEIDGVWVKEQNISREFKVLAVEVTMTARTEVKDDSQVERLVTLASVIRPRTLPDGTFGSSGSSGSSPGGADDGGGPGSGPGGPGNPGVPGFPGGNGSGGGFGDGSGNGGGFGPASGNGQSGGGAFGEGGYNHRTRRIGRDPRLGERLYQGPQN